MTKARKLRGIEFMLAGMIIVLVVALLFLFL